MNWAHKDFYSARLMGNESRDGYNLGLEGFDSNYRTENHALVEFNRHYELSVDDESVLRGSRSSNRH